LAYELAVNVRRMIFPGERQRPGTAEDVTAIAKALVDRAKAGDIGAARVLLDRLVGSGDLRGWPDEAQVRERELLGRLLD
jgi:hypothetical protein